MIKKNVEKILWYVMYVTGAVATGTILYLIYRNILCFVH